MGFWKWLWVSLVAQSGKNLLPMQETHVRFLGWEDPRWRKLQCTPVLLPGEFHGQMYPAGYIYRVVRVRHNLVTKPPPAWNRHQRRSDTTVVCSDSLYWPVKQPKNILKIIKNVSKWHMPKDHPFPPKSYGNIVSLF